MHLELSKRFEAQKPRQRCLNFVEMKLAKAATVNAEAADRAAPEK